MNSFLMFFNMTSTTELANSWATSSNKSENVAYQVSDGPLCPTLGISDAVEMYAEFSHDTAYKNVQYGVVLNESYVTHATTDPVTHPSSAILFKRDANHIFVAQRLFSDGEPPPRDEVISKPFELLLALSVLPTNAYHPPAAPARLPRLPKIRVVQGTQTASSTANHPPAPVRRSTRLSTAAQQPPEEEMVCLSPLQTMDNC